MTLSTNVTQAKKQNYLRMEYKVFEVYIKVR